MPIDPPLAQALAAGFSWTNLVGSTVAAAIVSGTFLWATNSRRFKLDRELTRQKIDADRALAKEKLEFDKELAQHRFDLDVRFLERKAAVDQAQVAWRRRFELAEQILSAAYEARDALLWARARVVLEGEGETRPASGSEDEETRAARNSAFVPIERLTAHSKAFATLQAAQDNAGAYFGSSVTKPILDLLGEHRKISIASAYLGKLAQRQGDGHGAHDLRPFREEIWGTGSEAGKKAVDGSIQQLEMICKPVLSSRKPA